MEVEFKIDGEKQLFKNLRILDDSLQAKFLIQSARTALNRIGKEARSKIKDDTGLLSKSVQSEIRIYRGGSVLYGVLGINSRTQGVDRFGNKRRPVKYAHLTEF